MEQEELASTIIGCAMGVHQTLGPGFLESVYQNALLIELRGAGLFVEKNVRIPVYYQGEIVGEFIADVLVAKNVILELKAAQEIHPSHEAQLVNYLQATGLGIGLILNFGSPSLQFKRKHRTYRPKLLRGRPVDPVKKALRNPAFSLLELLVAMAVMGGLLVLLLGVVDGVTKLWRESEGRVEAYREARAALGVIVRDLQNVAPTTNAGHFLLNEEAFALLAPVADIVTNTDAGSAVFLLSALPARAQDPAANRSDVCQAGYFLAFGKSSSASNSPVNTMNLYRYLLSSDSTFQRLTNSTEPLFPGDLATTGDPRVELLARNITGIALRAYAATGSALAPFHASASTPLPDLVEISLSAINQDAAKKLGPDVAAWSNSPVLPAATQTFTTRVRIPRPE